jgi:hypothetical protein
LLVNSHFFFPFQGSTLGRAVTPEQKQSFGENITYKDLDWIEAGKKLYMGPDCKVQFMEQLKKDCKVNFEKIFFFF